MLSKASKLESEFSCEAAAIADWASERSIVPKFNSNIRDFLNCFAASVTRASNAETNIQLVQFTK